jgi:hypothetical protein
MYWAMIFLAALLEFWGDALIRKGIQGWGLAFVLLGFLLLGTYGIVVNLTGSSWLKENFGFDLSGRSICIRFFAVQFSLY